MTLFQGLIQLNNNWKRSKLRSLGLDFSIIFNLALGTLNLIDKEMLF